MTVVGISAMNGLTNGSRFLLVALRHEKRVVVAGYRHDEIMLTQSVHRDIFPVQVTTGLIHYGPWPANAALLCITGANVSKPFRLCKNGIVPALSVSI
jgi:hypothetical protein